jgi:type I restriction enzyme S subunit
MVRGENYLNEQETETRTTSPLGFTVSSNEFRRGDKRLDASNYGRESARLRQVLERSGFPLVAITKFTKNESPNDIFNLGRFKRVWTDDPENGYPYLSASETMLRKPVRSRFVSKNKTVDADKFFTKEGWILMTCSGTVGQPMIVTKDWANFFYTHDLMRIVPKTNEAGFLYAYLSSKFGQAVLTKGQYGGTVKHLEAHHLLSSITIPVIQDDARQRIHEMIMKAYVLREEANQLENDAIKELERKVEEHRDTC